MDVKEAIETLLDIKKETFRAFGLNDDIAFDMAIEALELQKRIDNGLLVPKEFHDKTYGLLQRRYFDLLEKTRWIPVTERLPTEKDANTNGLVHVWLKDGNCDYEDWQDVARYAERYQRVTHWMPLPEPPEVE